MKPITIMSLAAIGLLGGCVSPEARRGRVVQAEIGNRHPNFSFHDERGRTQDLTQNLGDFTVLVFSECGEDVHGPVSKALLELVRPNQSPGYAMTIGFDVHWSTDGCPQHDDCHLLQGGQHIFSICDARSKVRDLFRADSGGAIIVIGPDRRVVERARIADVKAVSRRLAGMFSNHAKMVIETRSPDE